MNRQRQSGNAIVFILLGIALFAGLAHTFMRGSQQGQGDLSAHQTKLLATEYMGYGASIRKAIERLLNRGCSESELSFQSSNWPDATWYQNNNSPVNNSCHIFHPDGGGITWTDFPTIKYDSNYGSPWFATGDTGAALTVQGFGTDTRHDLYMATTQRTDLGNNGNAMKLCKEINKIGNVPENSSNLEKLPSFYHGAFNMRYKGVFNDNNGAINVGANLNGYSAFCAQVDGNTFTIITPLLIR
ncbi:MAG: hypothetical protein DI626_03470 [Micavibrio aeruginosavorus]|uniref:Uncharacterized protein n=1 Tax=Micavibrio aeruginosavorus TaxID=349221 RepID=A0A2W5BX62_9BACT|nr:MAG: hypothetical protein DI626_03470 [Micavibrio aeruginosavorus]